MKLLKALILTSSLLLILFIGTVGYVVGLESRKDKTFPNFRKGQLLYPDMVHSDTLIVYDPEYLNECLSNGRLKSDDDIIEILNETTVTYSHKH